MNFRWEAYPCKVNGSTSFLVRDSEMREALKKRSPLLHPRNIGLLALALFWRDSHMDYIAVGFQREKEEWTRMFEQYDLLDWMAGFVLPVNQRRQRDLAVQHRNNQTFLETYGWTPDTVIELRPSEHEREGYTQAIIGGDLDDDEHLHRALNEALREEFQDGVN